MADHHSEVQVIDGGTLGLELLSVIEDAPRLLVLDAVLADGPAATLMRLAEDEVPAYLGIHSSPHEIALPDLLAAARLRGCAPDEIVVLGLSPETIELGWDLSAPVAARLDVLADAAAVQLHCWGVALAPIEEASACTR
jgi:hydrogenase maturation protease